MSPKVSYFTEGMAQGGRDVRRTLDFSVAQAMSTSFPALPLSIPERREWLRGYAAGLLQGLSGTRPRNETTPVTKEEEGTAH